MSGAATARSYSSSRSFGDESKWTVSAVLKHLPEGSVPGPGAYEDPHENRHRSPAYSMPKTPRTPKPVPINPLGPGTYDVAAALKLKSRTPNVSISTTRSSGLFDGHSQVPGPGAYSPEKPLAKSPSAIISQTARNGPSRPTSFWQGTITPGPGFYDTSVAMDLKPSTPTITMSRATYTAKQEEPGPGPASYDTAGGANSRHTYHSTISRTTKVPSLPSTDTPGPGYYEDKTALTFRRSPSVHISNPAAYTHHNQGLNAEEIVRDMERVRTERLVSLSRDSSVSMSRDSSIVSRDSMGSSRSHRTS